MRLILPGRKVNLSPPGECDGTDSRSIGSIPHPKGSVSVHYKVIGGKIEAEIDSPVVGQFSWNGKTAPITAGKNQITL